MGENSKPDPIAFGVQLGMITPFGRYHTPRRMAGFASALAMAVNAGNIPSSSGKPGVAPTALWNVRRGRYVSVMIMARFLPESIGLLRKTSSLLERHAPGDA